MQADQDNCGACLGRDLTVMVAGAESLAFSVAVVPDVITTKELETHGMLCCA